MDRVQVFLRSRLFYTGENSHVPRGAVILEGEVIEEKGGFRLLVSTWRDDQGAILEGESRKLFIPSSKIDHVWYLD